MEWKRLQRGRGTGRGLEDCGKASIGVQGSVESWGCDIHNLMWNGHSIYGFYTWKIRGRLLQVLCYERSTADLRMSFRFPKRKGYWEKGGCTHFARLTTSGSIDGMERQAQ